MKHLSLGEKIAWVGLVIACLVLVVLIQLFMVDSNNQRENVKALETQNALLLEKVDQQEEIIEEYKYQEWYELHCTLSMIECVK